MNNTPVTYSPKEMEKLQNYITTTFGSPGDFLAHEITSEYVHTDVQVCHDQNIRHLVTFGMSARAMQSPLPDFQRTELVMSVSDSFDLMSREGGVLLGELTDLTKYPFRNDTWFGHGHTVAASKAFRETFGYDAWLLLDFQEDAPPLDNGEEIHFLQAIPIYRDERAWIMENDSVLYFTFLYNAFGERAVLVNSGREHLLPDEETAALYGLLSVLGTDKKTLQDLQTYLEKMEETGEDVSYEMMGNWLQEHGSDTE